MGANEQFFEQYQRAVEVPDTACIGSLVTENSVAARTAGDSGAAAARTSGRTWWTAIIYLAAAAMLLRFYDLRLKPLHHDEGVNTLFLTGLVNPPHAYRYDPANYHGPTLYYFGWLSVAWLGLTTVAIRTVTAMVGLLAVLLVLPLRRQLGSVGALAAAALLALSPGAVYFSRYFIHEMLLVCFTLAAVGGIGVVVAAPQGTRSLPGGSRRRFDVATKETAVISAVVVLIAAAGAAALVELRGLLRDSGRRQSVRDLATALLQSSRGFVKRLRERAGVPVFLAALLVFIATNIVFYTSFFTHWQGAIDALETFAIWTKTGTSAHPRPWHTYLEWLSAEELPLLLLGATGTLLALWKARNRFAVFVALWSVGEVAAYSLIPYKTPWLTLNMTAPLALAAGYACQWAWERRSAVPTVCARRCGGRRCGADDVPGSRLELPRVRQRPAPVRLRAYVARGAGDAARDRSHRGSEPSDVDRGHISRSVSSVVVSARVACRLLRACGRHQRSARHRVRGSTGGAGCGPRGGLRADRYLQPAARGAAGVVRQPGAAARQPGRRHHSVTAKNAVTGPRHG